MCEIAAILLLAGFLPGCDSPAEQDAIRRAWAEMPNGPENATGMVRDLWLVVAQVPDAIAQGGGKTRQLADVTRIAGRRRRELRSAHEE